MIQKDHVIVFSCCLFLILILFIFPGNVDMVNLNLFSSAPITTAISDQPVMAEVGQPLIVDQVEAVVTNVQVVAGNVSVPLQMGSEYILVNIRMLNLGRTGYNYSPFDFYVEDSSGTISTNQLVSLPGYTDDVRLQSSLIPDHGSVAGYLVFQCFQRDHVGRLVWMAHTLANTSVQALWNITF